MLEPPCFSASCGIIRQSSMHEEQDHDPGYLPRLPK